MLMSLCEEVLRPFFLKKKSFVEQRILGLRKKSNNHSITSKSSKAKKQSSRRYWEVEKTQMLKAFINPLDL